MLTKQGQDPQPALPLKEQSEGSLFALKIWPTVVRDGQEEGKGAGIPPAGAGKCPLSFPAVFYANLIRSPCSSLSVHEKGAP